MFNPYQSWPVTILDKQEQTPRAQLFVLRFSDRQKQASFQFWPGQFMMVGLPGWGEAPLAVCSSPLLQDQFLEITVRAVGPLTQKINTLTKGDFLYVRGPFGNGFPIWNKQENFILISGGCGLVPFRSLIVSKCIDPLTYGKMTLFYGVQKETDFYFRQEYQEWQRYISLHLITQQQENNVCYGSSGLVTDLLKKIKKQIQTKIFICGPEPMMRSVGKLLLDKGFLSENLFVSLERRMHCGVGICQHCACGSHYVCKDGPVFSWEQYQQLQKYQM